MAFTLQLWKTSDRRQSDEGCATSHRLKWSPLPPNDVCRILQHVREEKGRMGREMVILLRRAAISCSWFLKAVSHLFVF